jgi:4-hydroxybenzoate polyprenyltransferase
MIKKTLATTKKFHSYQKERFPLVVLGLSFLPAILSSGAVMSRHTTWVQAVFALVASLAYLLHVRVVDEHRDFEHDNLHHTARPIQVGTISKEELRQVDTAAVVLLIVIAAVMGPLALILVALMLVYSYFAEKEFFIGEHIRRHFFIYNGVNLVQMLFLQFFVYAIFANPFPFTTLVWAHFLFTTVGTVIFEFVRKLKRPGDDGSGKDTYTWHMGFSNALIVYALLLLLNTILFFWIAALIPPLAAGWLVFLLALVGSTYLTALMHWVKKTRQTDQIMQLSFLIQYGIFNLVIYFLVFH